MKFDPKVWCGPNQPGIPARCALGPAEIGSPPVASDTFGAYDEQSKKNGFRVGGICDSSEPQSNVGQPTEGDGSAVEELFFSQTAAWAPFRPLGRSVSPTQPLDYELAPGVDPTGSPAIASFTSPAVEIFVRGTDDKVYGIHSQLAGSLFQDWSAWEEVPLMKVDADPAVVLADDETLFIAVRSQEDGAIHLRMRKNGVWGAWASLGAPAAGAASAPAIAALGGGALSIVVRAIDGYLYELSCADSASLCAASAGSGPDGGGFGGGGADGGDGGSSPDAVGGPDAGSANAWSPLPPPPRAGGLIGKPSIVFRANQNLFVTAVTADQTGWLIGNAAQGWGGWEQIQSLDLLEVVE